MADNDAGQSSLGERLRARREAAGLSQRDLVRKLSRKPTYQSTLARVEQGLCRPSLGLLEELATIYNCTLDDLTRGLVEPGPIEHALVGGARP